MEKLMATAMYMKEEDKKMMVLSHVSVSFSGSRSFRKNLAQKNHVHYCDTHLVNKQTATSNGLTSIRLFVSFSFLFVQWHL